MCDFCENIPTNDEEFEKKRDEDYNADFIFKAECGFGIYVNTGDSFQPGILTKIAFCPYCGRKLSEETEKMCDTDIAYMSGASVYKGDNGKGLLVADFWCSNCHKEYVGEIMRDGFVCECGKKIKMG